MAVSQEIVPARREGTVGKKTSLEAEACVGHLRSIMVRHAQRLNLKARPLSLITENKSLRAETIWPVARAAVIKCLIYLCFQVKALKK